MKRPYQPILCGLFCLISISHVHAALGDPATDSWQLRRLQQPTPAELRAERDGQVMIYHGLTDKQVAAVMDNQFNRIQYMMFTGIIVTNSSGAPKKDAETGELVTEDDGC